MQGKSRLVSYFRSICCLRHGTPSVYLNLENGTGDLSERKDVKQTAVGRTAILRVIFDNGIVLVHTAP